MKNNSVLRGTGILTGFIFRRERVKLPIWIFALSIFVVGLVPVFEEILMFELEREVLIDTMKNPAMIAMVGPVYGENNYNLGAAFSNYMLLFSVMIAATMNIFLVKRHTREDEESGRIEMILSMVVGRLSSISSTMLVAFISNILISVATGVGLYLFRGEGMDFIGCMLFGTSLGTVGMFFGALTALFCQISSSSRTALGLSFFLLFLLYIIRAIGDIKYEILSLISPLGLILRTEIFVNNYWWPAVTIGFLAIFVTGLSFYLSANRDLGQGLVNPRPGKRNASKLLSSPTGLAIKLIRTSAIIWGLVVFILAAMYGSVFGDLESYIKGSPALAAIFSINSDYSVTEQFIGLLTVIMSMIATIPILTIINRVAGEEKNGMVENILTKPVSRTALIRSYLLPTMALSIAYQVIIAYGFWSAGSVVLEGIPSFMTFLISTIIYLPAIWVMIGIAIIFIGYFPRKSYIVYIYLVVSFFVVYIGQIAKFPEWTLKITPYGYISKYPIEDIDWVKIVALLAVALFAVVIGSIGYNKRDSIID